MPAKSDKLFQRRKRASRGVDQRSLQRTAPTKQPRKRVLIVCEGIETEKRYFHAIVNELQLTSVEVEICTDCGSAPISVVEHAEKRVRSEAGKPYLGFDIVLCVFDRDEHDSFYAALTKIDGLSKSRSFPIKDIIAVYSNPCIEYWFMLHFKYSRAPAVRSNGRSPGENMLRELKSQPDFADYKKSITNKQIVSLLDNTQQAREHALRGEKDLVATGNENPITKVHHAIDVLKRIKCDAD